MIYNLCSDPHLGLSRKTHTTRDSARRWGQEIFVRTLEAVGREGKTVLNGDLFDRTYNTETVISQGIAIALECEKVLAGNHDETNRADTKCSLDIVAGVTQNVVKQEELGVPFFSHNQQMFMVPHHPTQELFHEALTSALHEAAASQERYKYLFVHCNRGELPNMTEETLTILDEQEDELLQVFDRIFYGHLHEPKIEKEGKVIQLGNIFPTSFSDISNKFTWLLNSETNELSKEVIFDASDSSKKLKLGQPFEELEQVMFFEVTGTGTRSEIADYVQQVWEVNPQVLAVRANCEFIENGVVVEEIDISDLHSVISRGLADTPQLDLYNQLRDELCS